MNFSKGLLVALLGSLLLSACGPAPEAAVVADRKGGSDHAADPIRHVQTTAAQEKDIDQLVVVTGTLGAEQEVVLGFKISGRVADISVDLGGPVQKGGPIARWTRPILN